MRRLYRRAKRGYRWETDNSDFTPAYRAGLFFGFFFACAGVCFTLARTREMIAFTFSFGGVLGLMWVVALLVSATYADIEDDDNENENV